MEAGIQRAQLYKGTFEHVGQRQIRQHALFGAHTQSLNATSSGKRHVFEAEHYTLGPTSTARGVHNGCQLFRLTVHLTFQRRVLGHDVVPGLEIVGRAQGVGNATHGIRNARLHAVPVVQLAHKQNLAFGVVQDVVDGIRIQGWVQGYGNMAGQPDRPVGHDPLRAVLRNKTNTALFRQVKGLQVRRHPAGFINCPAPGVFNHLAVANRLSHVRGISFRGFPVVQHIEGKFVCCVHGPS